MIREEKLLLSNFTEVESKPLGMFVFDSFGSVEGFPSTATFSFRKGLSTRERDAGKPLSKNPRGYDINYVCKCARSRIDVYIYDSILSSD